MGNKGKKMNVTFWLMSAFALGLAIAAYARSSELPMQGLVAGGRLFISILPVLIPAFIVAGLITVLLPKEYLSRWIGDDSGLGGMLIATFAGCVTPGGPFVQFPIVAALYKSGAGVGPLMAYVSAWSLLGVHRIFVWEVPLLGWRLTFIRVAASLVFPVLIGYLSRLLWMYGRVQP